MRLPVAAEAQDSGVRLVVDWVELSAVVTRLGYRLADNPFPYAVSQAALHTESGCALPLLRSDTDVLEFGPVPPGDPVDELRVSRLTDPSSAGNLADTSPLSDPFDVTLPVTPGQHELSGHDLIGWWSVPLPHQSSPPGQVRVLDRRIAVPEHELIFHTFISDAAGALLRCEVEPPRDLRPHVVLRSATLCYLAELSGPWGPQQNRYYARFDAFSEPVELVLDGLMGVPLAEPTACTFSPRRHFEIADWHVDASLGVAHLKGRIFIDQVVRETGSLFLCTRIEIDGGDIEHASVSGGTITSAEGHVYESEGESTVWVEAEQTYRSGLSFPPVHEVGEEVTLTVHTVDVTLRQPIAL